MDQYSATFNAGHQNDGDIRTVFISGLPDDVKEREIHNLFRLVPGYEGSKITLMNNRPVSFATFQTRDAATNAISTLHGIKFDPDQEYTIRLQFARSNSKTKRLISDHGDQQEKKRRITGPVPQTMYPYGGYPDPNYSYGPYGYPADPYSMAAPIRTPFQPSHTRPSSRAPCTTLFVTGFDNTITQNDLVSIFSSAPGYKKLRMGKDNIQCFVDYVDSNASSMALSTLNGYQFGACVFHVDYAKSKMGENRDRGDQSSHQQQEQGGETQ